MDIHHTHSRDTSTLRHVALLLIVLMLVLGMACPAYAADTPTVNHVSVTTHPANDHYLNLSFDFTANGKTYTAFITGIRSDAAPSLWAKPLATKIAGSFSQGKQLRIVNRSSGKRGEYVEPLIDLMDAEKQNLREHPHYDTGDIPTVVSDSGLCWAAAASNALELSGWGRAATELNPGVVDFRNEDDIFAYFADNFLDAGSLGVIGVKWFMDGINFEQMKDKVTGEVVFGRYNDDSAQLVRPGTGGLIADICYASVTQTVYDGDMEGPKTLLSSQGLRQISDDLESGCGVIMGVEFLGLGGGHELCLTGTIRRKTSRGSGDVVAVFFADSDNDGANYQYGDQQAEEKAGPRAERVNSFEMFPLSSEKFFNMPVPFIKGFYMGEGYETIFSNAAAITPYKADLPKETVGSRDVYAQPDLDIQEIIVTDDCVSHWVTVGIGKEIELHAHLHNQSFVRLTDESSARVTVRYHLYRDGKEYDTVTTIAKLEGKALLPHEYDRDAAMVRYIFNEAGVYDISAEIVSIEDANGPIREAYTQNNTLLQGRGTVTNKVPKPPKTGDESMPVLWTLLLAASAAMLTILCGKKGRV